MWGELAKSRLLLISVVIVLSLFVNSQAFCGEPPIRLVIDGREIVPDVMPRIVEGRTLVPVRIVSEELGATVGWDEQTRTVTVCTSDTEISLRIGDGTAWVNDAPVRLDVPATIVDSRTLVPIRFVATALGADVTWEGDSRTVKVNRVVPDPSGLSLTSLDYEILEEGVRFTIKGKGLQRYSAKTLAGEGKMPDRLILDFEGLQMGLAFESLPLDLGPVERVRTGLMDSPPTARLVFDLTGPVRYEVKVAEAGDLLNLVVRHKVTGVELKNTDDGPMVSVHTTGPVAYRVLELGNPPKLVVDIPDTTLAQGVETSMRHHGDVLAQVRVGQFQVDPDIVRIVADLKDASGYNVEKGDAGLVINFLSCVRNLTWGSWAGGSRLRIEASGPIKAEVSKKRGRLLIDIPVATWGMTEREFSVNQGAIDCIRVEERRMSPPSVHIEVDLLEDKAVHVVTSGQNREVIIEIGNATLEGKRIMIDPGHGGLDPGAISVSGHFEKDITLPISVYLREFLEAAGAEVRMTRTGDQTVEVKDRAYMANVHEADAFISIHANSYGDKAKRGIEIYHCSKRDDTIELAQTVLDTMTSHLGLEDRGVRKAEFLVLVDTDMKAVLAEVGYLSNPDEERLLIDRGFQQRIAESIGTALVHYFSTKVR